jgi:hypothetical protein
MSTNQPPPGTGGYFQIKDGDWANLNRALRYAWDQIDRLSGRRGNIPLGNDLDLGGHRAINAADPTDTADLVTKKYGDANYGPKPIQQALLLPGSDPLIQGPSLGAGSPIFLEGTHAVRPAAASYGVGSVYFETDRTVNYLNVLNSSAVQIWQYNSGGYSAAIASIPGDLGTNDKGFRFVDTSAVNQTEYFWTDSAWVTIGGFLQSISDAATATVTTLALLQHLTSGTAGVGFGGGEVTQLHNAAGTLITSLYRTIAWTNATHPNEAADFDQWLMNAGTLTRVLSLISTGDWVMRVTTGLLKFGGTSSSFPALKQVAGLLHVRLADDSGDGQIVGRWTPRVTAVADGASWTPNSDTGDIVIQVNTQAMGTLTMNAPTATAPSPYSAQRLELWLTSTNVQTFAWNAIYVGCTTTPLPTTSTGGGKTDKFYFQYNATATKWQLYSAEFGYA